VEGLQGCLPHRQEHMIVLECTHEAGKNILMSGGSRCNILPLIVDPTIAFFTASSKCNQTNQSK
jgi:predicted flavoprotein YhiN